MTFLPRSKHLLTSWLQSLFTVILEPKKRKPVTGSTFPPFYLLWSEGTRCHIGFLNVEFSLSFTLIKRLFSFSSLSAIRVVSSAYLRLLIFLPAILILACDSSSLAFHIMSLYIFHGQRSLVGYSPWGSKDLDMTEWLTLSLSALPGKPSSGIRAT